VILLCVRWYLRYPLAYEHVAELLAERGVEAGNTGVMFTRPGKHKPNAIA
jgi:transposase-like protein